MSATTDYMSPFNDGYNIFNQFDRILFVPHHPLLQSELNELQSGQQDQQRWIANWSMNNGTILSGMGLKNEGYSDKNSVPDDTNENLFINNSDHLSTNNLIVSTGDKYTDHGEIDMTSDATEDSQPLYMNVKYNIPNHVQYITVSFDICETGTTDDGELENIGMELFNGTSISEATIDGRILKDGELQDDDGYNLTDTRNDMIDLSDGNYHQVEITMDVSKVGSQTNSFNLILNAGYPAVEEGCNVQLNHFKIEQGTDATTWELSPVDKPAGSDQRNNTVFVSSGFVYLDGYVRHFKAQSIQITGEGFEKIGLHLSHQNITSADDKELDDQTQGTSTYGNPGADREKYNLTLTYSNNAINEPHNAIIYYLHNGVVIATANWNRKARLEDELAQRTYETNGSFLSSGLKMFAYPDHYDSSLIDLQFAPGTAYVLGHRINKDGSDILPIPVERETTEVVNDEQTLYKVSNPSNSPKDPTAPYYQDISFGSDVIKPQSSPVSPTEATLTGGVSVSGTYNGKQVFSFNIEYNTPSNIRQKWEINHGDYNEVSCDFRVNSVVFSRDAYVYDPHKPNIRYYSDYTVNTDNPNNPQKADNFSLTGTDNQIQWNNEESPFKDGDTAYISAHQKGYFHCSNPAYEVAGKGVPSRDEDAAAGTTNINPDYYLIKLNHKYYISFNECDKKYDVTGAANNPEVHLSGNAPILNDADDITLDYFAYLSREDLITLNRNGQFFDIKGEPALQDEVMPPVNTSRGDNLTLNIGYVTVFPNQQIAHTRMATIPKVPFTGIDNMRLQISALQYNMSILAANQSTMSAVDPNTLIDIFADFFTNTDKANVSDIFFNILYNPEPYITPGYNAEGYIDLTSNQGQHSITLPVSSENTSYINQDNATDSLQLNNFGLKNHIGIITCDPDSINDKLTTEEINDPTTVEQMNDASAAAKLQSASDDGVSYATLYTQGGRAAVANMNLSPEEQDYTENAHNLELDGDEFQSHTSTLKTYRKAYIAPQFIHISGTGFIPNSKGYSVYLPNENNLHLGVSAIAPLEDPSQHNKYLPGTKNEHHYPDGVSVDSDTPNTVDADEYGNISCWFKIPKGQVRCGTQKVVLCNHGGEQGIDTIDANLFHPVKYNHVDDVMVTNDDIINYNSEIASDATQSLSASTSADTSFLADNILSLSTSASASASNITSIMNSDNASLNEQIASADVSMDAITAIEEEDADVMNSFISYQNDFNSETAKFTSDQLQIDSEEADDLSNLSASCDSLYYDHLEDEDQIGNLRAGLDSVADNEAALGDEVHNDEQQYNSDFGQVDDFEGDISNQLTNDQNTDMYDFNQMRTQADQANRKQFAETAQTPRQLLHDEYDPDVFNLGSHRNGSTAWSRRTHTNLNFAEIIKNNFVKPGGKISQRWDHGQDAMKAYKDGGLWFYGHELLKPHENPSVRTVKRVINRIDNTPGIYTNPHCELVRLASKKYTRHNVIDKHAMRLLYGK